MKTKLFLIATGVIIGVVFTLSIPHVFAHSEDSILTRLDKLEEENKKLKQEVRKFIKANSIGTNGTFHIKKNMKTNHIEARNIKANNIQANIIQAINVVPIGSIVAWHKSFSGTPQSLPKGWVECNGQKLNDNESPYNDKHIPNLNGEKLFIRGGTVSGVKQKATRVAAHISEGRTLVIKNLEEQINVAVRIALGQKNDGSTSTEGSVRPANMSVVWIMRIK